jgi:hypothetical protein
MPMHEKNWGRGSKSWGDNKDTTNLKPWPSTLTKQTTPRSISNATTADRSATTFTDKNTTSRNRIMTHLYQHTTFGSEPHMYSYQPFGAQNAAAGLVIMTNSMTNEHSGRQ